MEKPLISVIILSYNNLAYFEECLMSVLVQTYPNIEIILSDDGSLNFEKDIVLDFINKNKKENIKRVIINHNEANLGVVKNYNKAIKMSKGEYIFYIGMDDMLYDENVISEVIKFFKESNSLIFTGYRCIYDEKMEKCLGVLPRKIEKEFIKRGDPLYLYKKLTRGNFIAGSCTPFSRKLIEKYGYLDEDYVLLEDYPRYLYLTRDGCKFGFIERKLIKYRLGGITTNNKKNEKLERDLEIVREKEIRGLETIKKLVSRNMKGKKKIGWAVSEGYQRAKKKLDLDKIDIKFLVDSDVNKQGHNIDGRKIYSPEKIKSYNKDEIYIIIFSQSYYYEIAEELGKLGFRDIYDFCCFTDLMV